VPAHEKILFVDDEPAVLEAYQRLLHDSFPIDIALGGKAAVAMLTAKEPYAVVISDLRMPEMDGLAVLSQAKKFSPNTVRIMLTGHAAIETAMSAINDSSIFRFLTKPCPKEKLESVLAAALQQYRLHAIEKDLVEKTFMGIIQMLTEVLGLVNPAAFSRAVRLRKYVKRMGEVAGVKDPWRLEVAAMMSQLGCVTLDSDLINTLHKGQALSAAQQLRYDRHPEVAQRLLATIPRMEAIAWMIGHQNKAAPMDSDLANREKVETRKEAELLRQAIDFDEITRKGVSRVEAGHRMSRKYKTIDQSVLLSLVKMEPEADEMEIMTLPVEQVSSGMVLQEDVYSAHGLLVVAKGQEVNLPLRLKLDSFHQKEPFMNGVRVSIAKPSSP
jgi:response regulator RpfG family c-di-GMP phosphodiesterase